MQTWLYHSKHDAKIIDTDIDDLEDLWKQGWRDSPAKLPVAADVPKAVSSSSKAEERQSKR